MNLTPLANITAVLCTDEAELADYGDRLTRQYGEVHKPAPGWVLGIQPVRGSSADHPEAVAAGIVFMEGRDSMLSRHPTAAEIETARRQLLKPGQFVATRPDDLGAMVFDHHSVNIVRSVSGRVPTYVRRVSPSTILVSTLLSAQVTIGHAAEIDALPLCLGASTGAIFPDRRTPLKGVQTIPPGCTCRLTPSGQTIRNYWEPPQPIAQPPEDDVLSRQEMFRDRLIAVLRSELDPHAETLIALSGGVDSSALAVFAAKECRPLRSFTIEMQRGTASATHNARFVKAALIEASIQDHTSGHWDHRTALEWIRNGPRSVQPLAEPVTMRLPQLIDEQTVGFMGGWLADEVTGSHHGADAWYRNKSFGYILKPKGPVPRGRSRALKSKLRTSLIHPSSVNLRVAKPDWTGSDLGAEFDEWLGRASRPEWAGHPRAELLVAHLWHGREGHWEATSEMGVRSIIPFAAKSLLDISYSCHPDELLGERTKMLLRGSLARDVSHYLLGRPDKGRFVTEEERSVQISCLDLPTEVCDLLSPNLQRPGAVVSASSAQEIAAITKAVADIRSLATGSTT